MKTLSVVLEEEANNVMRELQEKYKALQEKQKRSDMDIEYWQSRSYCWKSKFLSVSRYYNMLFVCSIFSVVLNVILVICLFS